MLKINLEENSSIRSIKAIIETQQNIPIKEQRLMWDGDYLKDYLTLKEAGFESGVILQFSHQLEGGGLVSNAAANQGSIKSFKKRK